MGELVVRGRKSHGVVVVDVEGDLGQDSASALLDALLAHLPPDGGFLVVHLAKVSSCDPAALSALITVKRVITRAGSRFLLVAPGYLVARALRVTGLARNLEICPSIEAARRRMGSASLPRQRGASDPDQGAAPDPDDAPGAGVRG